MNFSRAQLACLCVYLLAATTALAQQQPPSNLAAKPSDAPLRNPVIFSYGHPWGSDRNPNDGWTDPWFMDFGKVRLSTANMIDNVAPKAYADWRLPSRRILARTSSSAEAFNGDKATGLIKAWDEALNNELIDGFAMDEFLGSNASSESIRVWVTAIKEIRRRHPDKILAFWTDSGLGRIREHGNAHESLLTTIRDYADFIMPEIYFAEKAASDFKTNPKAFWAFREKVEEWEQQAPGITPKILMGLGAVQNADWGYDTLPDIDYGEFLSKQIEFCATDPVLQQMGGLALYAPGYLKPHTLDKVNDAIIKHYRLHE